MSITPVIVALVALLSSVQSASLSSKPKFAKSTFNDMSVGNEPDVAKVLGVSIRYLAAWLDCVAP